MHDAQYKTKQNTRLNSIDANSKNIESIELLVDIWRKIGPRDTHKSAMFSGVIRHLFWGTWHLPTATSTAICGPFDIHIVVLFL